MSEQITGYLLLTLGVCVILLSTISVYLVFTNKAQPVQLFNFSGVAIDPSLLAANLPATDQPIAKKQPIEIISGGEINKISNLMAHVFLMSFIAGAGFKLASLGTLLVRPIVVKLKAKDAAVAETP